MVATDPNTGLPSLGMEPVATAFVEMAHRIVWATLATVDSAGRPRTRIVHPIWEWDGHRLTGWFATSPASPKGHHIEHDPHVSLTYWHPDQDVCTADCVAEFEPDPADRQAGWDRFANAPEPVGYDPRIIPDWTSPEADAFGIVRLDPTSLRVFPGTLLLRGEGELLTWRA